MVRDILIKELKPGQIVVMDNINFHKTSKVKELIESRGASILFLPTYSPDLNSIEHYWFKIKNKIRKIANNFEIFDKKASSFMGFIAFASLILWLR